MYLPPDAERRSGLMAGSCLSLVQAFVGLSPEPALEQGEQEPPVRLSRVGAWQEPGLMGWLPVVMVPLRFASLLV
jgi:hypothetical protein